MTPVNPFILKNKEKMINFLDELSVSENLVSRTHSDSERGLDSNNG